jgi:hypothetical protein
MSTSYGGLDSIASPRSHQRDDGFKSIFANIFQHFLRKIFPIVWTEITYVTVITGK